MHLNKNRELGGVNNFPAVALYTGYIYFTEFSPCSRPTQVSDIIRRSSKDAFNGFKAKIATFSGKKETIFRAIAHIMYESRHKVSS